MLELGQKNIAGPYDSFGEFFEGEKRGATACRLFEALPSQAPPVWGPR